MRGALTRSEAESMTEGNNEAKLQRLVLTDEQNLAERSRDRREQPGYEAGGIGKDNTTYRLPKREKRNIQLVDPAGINRRISLLPFPIV